ncbi:hypothetical protein [Actinotalea caeni]|uniref:hypothetical protein n=1 Tax=Actinotalea caeni TaxID=1348467 RepID=UPI0012E21FF5|nr:hypothetical protein [Actinotalea caeni]
MTRARWVWLGIGAAVVAVLLAVTGIDPAHAVLGGLLLAIGVLVLVHLGVGQRVALPRLPFDRREGVRTEVSSLSWALYRPDGVTPHALRRIRQVCRTGLAEASIDVDSTLGAERAAALLGQQVATFLTDPAAPPPDAHAVRAAVLALEKLEKSA